MPNKLPMVGVALHVKRIAFRAVAAPLIVFTVLSAGATLANDPGEAVSPSILKASVLDLLAELGDLCEHGAVPDACEQVEVLLAILHGVSIQPQALTNGRVQPAFAAISMDQFRPHNHSGGAHEASRYSF